jgi:hypothetical protein
MREGMSTGCNSQYIKMTDVGQTHVSHAEKLRKQTGFAQDRHQANEIVGHFTTRIGAIMEIIEPTNEEIARLCAERKLTGYDLKRIRERCGYSAREFADYLLLKRARITTARSVYRVESMRTIPYRYVEALKDFVGRRFFNESLTEIVRREEENRRWREERERVEEEAFRERQRRKAERVARRPGQAQ